jgi:hypothetical protein
MYEGKQIPNPAFYVGGKNIYQACSDSGTLDHRFDLRSILLWLLSFLDY